MKFKASRLTKIVLAVFILIFSNNITTHAQIISTVAGGGVGIGSAATSAVLDNLTGVAVDASGNTYIADANYNCIRKVSFTTGIISTVAGNGKSGYSGDGGAATSASLNNPQGIAIDVFGNLYIADCYNNVIRKVSASTGIISTVAGNFYAYMIGDGGAATSASLGNPNDVVVDVFGNLYISDYNNHRIRKVSYTTGIISTVAGTGIGSYNGDGGQAILANLYFTTGIAVDATGNLYIADSYNSRIRKVNSATGIISTVAGNGRSADGGVGGVATSTSLAIFRDLTVDAAGNIYIAETGRNRIRKVNVSTGIINTVAGSGLPNYSGDAGAATSAGLYSPSYLSLDAIGNIFISDVGNHRLRKVDFATSTISTVAGNGTINYIGDGSAATSAGLSFPANLSLDVSGNLYIADANNHRIRKLNVLTGIISTVAGSYGCCVGGDGGAATSAALNYPKGIALDATGNIFISDGSYIRKVSSATGIINTFAGLTYVSS